MVIQKAQEKNNCRYVQELHTTHLTDLDLILDQEKIFWKQKSRDKWLTLEDRNTFYFHKSAILKLNKCEFSLLWILMGLKFLTL